ncbi:diguanylate cyclase/phosphodiesterase [Syntrophobotulus glycolicus DSM 8271]|uniref:Diguanylate cyclase/phosphodiesterase n=1 Tax=Syntrophobotulus glycolicus (strain DSM 8271 / FlGlyR) TaxID=645991 RepID=F0T1E9_SYNGF|nr:EAL domain-containing protein [Syntrophobotulus glycolicus]ADY56290.1 diguanylate cyclase/phosphodiesterase [Syntrophobotulus glycolicus DSM 8271]
MQPLLNKNREISNIREIITNKRVIVHFQPVVSVSRKMVIGVEGLIRGINTGTNEIISPAVLFNAACDEGLTLELDRICREEVIKAFRELYQKNHDRLLFINVDASILDKVEGSNYLRNQVNTYEINPRNIVIEINETKVQDNTALKKFTDTYRKLGFMVAIDDVGTGFSNMDRILLIKPDMIKIDISLVRNINNDYYKQGVFKSLVNLANEIGALVIAEGAETEEEAIQILRLGGQMIQGYFFAKPQEIYNESTIFCNNKIEILSRSFNQYMSSKIRDEKQKNKNLNLIVNKSIKELVPVSCQEFDHRLLKIIWANKVIECAYILDEYGIQISNTIRFYDKNKVKDDLIFYSAMIGTDHSMEKYYYPLTGAGLKKYITEPYVSLATGNLCITISKVFTNMENKKYILCMDFNTNTHPYDLDLMKDMTRSDLIFSINGKSITEINRIVNKMNEEMLKDSLTNTYNRRYIEERLLVDIFNASNQNEPISVILADIDYFKKINDTYGHLAGDHVLREFAKIIKQHIRKNTDWIARYGGEEFLIVLSDSNENIAYRVAEKVRQAVEKARIRYNNKNICITASFGTYTLNSEKMTYEQLIDNADKNLYRAKNSGRNKTVS